MEKKRNRRPHNSTLNTLFANMLDSYTINWNDGTATTKAPSGKVITYKKFK